MDHATTIALSFAIVQLYLTVVAWRVGWRWKALLPYILSTVLGSIAMIPVMIPHVMIYLDKVSTITDPAMRNIATEEFANKLAADPMIVTLSYLLSFGTILVLILMVRNKRSKLESTSH